MASLCDVTMCQLPTHCKGCRKNTPSIIIPVIANVPAGEMQGGEQGEPTLKDVVQSLLSEDCIIVSNAANYLQHLAYGDNDIKERIG